MLTVVVILPRTSHSCADTGACVRCHTKPCVAAAASAMPAALCGISDRRNAAETEPMLRCRAWL